MKKLALALVLTLLSGCASEKKYLAVVTSWVGAPETSLVRSWGPPSNVYTTGDTKFLVYQSSRSIVVPGTAPTYQTTFVGNTAYTTAYGGTPPSQIDLGCQTTFEVRNGKIVDFSYRGNDCTAN